MRNKFSKLILGERIGVGGWRGGGGQGLREDALQSWESGGLEVEGEGGDIVR